MLKEAEAGVPEKDLCRRVGISDATFYHWKAKYGGLEVSETTAAASARRGERATEEDCCPAGIGSGRAGRWYWQKSGRPAGEARSGCVSYGKK